MKTQRKTVVLTSLMAVTFAARLGNGQCSNDWLPGEDIRG